MVLVGRRFDDIYVENVQIALCVVRVLFLPSLLYDVRIEWLIGKFINVSGSTADRDDVTECVWQSNTSDIHAISFVDRFASVTDDEFCRLNTIFVTNCQKWHLEQFVRIFQRIVSAFFALLLLLLLWHPCSFRL
jgi:hypothetical protein